MDARRGRRYVAKIDHARERLRSASEWLDPAAKDLMPRLAAYKAFQEAAESAADLAAMAIVDAGQPAKDDYSNFEIAARSGICSPALARPLAEATGLRNVLIHEYEGIETSRALESIERLAPAILTFLGEVEQWLTRSKP